MAMPQPDNRRPARLEPPNEDVALFRTGRFWKWFAAIWWPCPVVLLIRINTVGDRFQIVVLAILSAGAAIGEVQAFLTEQTEINRHRYSRATHPIRYWTSVSVMFLVHLAIVIAMAVSP